MNRREQQEALGRMAADPAAFRSALLIDTDAGPRPLAQCLDPWQRKDFEALDPGWRRVAGLPPDSRRIYGRGYLERARGHSKTSDLAVMATWVLFAATRKIKGVAAAADADQAKLLRDAIEQLVSLNPWLSQFLEVQTRKVISNRTGSVLEIISSDANSSYGLLVDFIIADELTVWPASGEKASGERLWNSLLSAAPKRKQCLLLVISNAGFGMGTSWQWKVREFCRQSDAWYFHRLNGTVASWISQEHLVEQRAMLPPTAYNRVWGSVWAGTEGDAIDEEQVSAAVTLTGPMLTAEPGWSFVAGLDIGLKKDASALVILGQHVGYTETRASEPAATAPRPPAVEAMLDLGLISRPILTQDTEQVYHAPTGRIRLVDLFIWRPGAGLTVSLTEIEETIRTLHSRYCLQLLAYDPYAFQGPAERLQGTLPCEEVNPTGPNFKSMAAATLEAFAERRIDLFDDGGDSQALLADIRALRVVEKNYGLRLESPHGTHHGGTNHGDAACALSLALHAIRAGLTRRPVQDNGPLTCWP